LLFLIQNHKDRRIQENSDWVHLSTVANSKTGNPPWLNIGSAGWLNIQSAPTVLPQLGLAAEKRDPKIEMKRLQIAARMMTTAQDTALALQKLKTGGTENVVVQHVHVEAGAQAVVGLKFSRGIKPPRVVSLREARKGLHPALPAGFFSSGVSVSITKI
jgi:hypothetical protein